MKKLLIGCAIVAGIAFLIVAIVVVRFGPGVFQFAKKSYSDEKEKRDFVSQWQPPTGNSAERFFPEQVAGFQRQEVSGNQRIETLHINRIGERAEYSANSASIEVMVWNGDFAEMKRVCGEMNQTYEKSSGSRTWLNFEYRCYYKTPDEQAHLWNLKGWLFLFVSRNNGDLNPFIRSYLHAIDAS